MNPSPQISGGHLFAKMLAQLEVPRVYGVPGESFLALLDGMVEANIPYIACRQEGGAAMMAEAEGKLSGRVGVCAVTRAPGATNASAGVHVAMQDSSPMVLIIGQADSQVLGREAFQEVDLVAMFAPLAKWSTSINDIKRIPEIVLRAFSVALSGRPGPVVLVVPEDIFSDTINVEEVAESIAAAKLPQFRQGVNQAAMKSLTQALADAERPLIILGGGGWNDTACAHLLAFVNNHPMPVMVEFRRQDVFPNTHPCYAGHLGFNATPAMRQVVAEADVVVLLGGRLGEVPSQDYGLINIPHPEQHFIHVHPAAEELGRVYAADLALVAAMPETCEALMTMGKLASQHAAQHQAFAKRAHEIYTATLTPKHNPGTLQLGEIMQWLNHHLPKDAIMCNGAGNYAIWLHRFYQWTQYGTQLAPASGSMGYGLPAAIAAALVHQHQAPPPPVLVFAGDGDFLMTGQELATAMQQRLPIIILVINNGLYGTIKMHQERHFNGRPIGTTLHNPDFVAFAQSFGLQAFPADTPEQFRTAFTQAQQHATRTHEPVLLALKQAPETLTPAS